jgi:hypothetical protein
MRPHHLIELARTLARRSILPIAVLFALSVLLQAFFAGSAALIDPQYWTLHVRWVGIFQWLSVVLLVAAWVDNRRRTAKWGSLAALAIIAGQYTSIHAAISHNLAWPAGAHAAGGFILFGVLLLIIVDCLGSSSGSATSPNR